MSSRFFLAVCMHMIPLAWPLMCANPTVSQTVRLTPSNVFDLVREFIFQPFSAMVCVVSCCQLLHSTCIRVSHGVHRYPNRWHLLAAGAAALTDLKGLVEEQNQVVSKYSMRIGELVRSVNTVLNAYCAAQAKLCWVWL